MYMIVKMRQCDDDALDQCSVIVTLLTNGKRESQKRFDEETHVFLLGPFETRGARGVRDSKNVLLRTLFLITPFSDQKHTSQVKCLDFFEVDLVLWGLIVAVDAALIPS